MAEYMLDNTRDPLTVAFVPLQVVMAAHVVHFSPDEGEGHWVEMKPVLGVMLRHTINSYGQVTGSRQEMAVQYDDTQEICTVDEYVDACGHSSYLVGVWPYKVKPEPSEEEVVDALASGRRLHAQHLARQARRAAS